MGPGKDDARNQSLTTTKAHAMNAPQTPDEKNALAPITSMDLANIDPTTLILGPLWDKVAAFGATMARATIMIPKHLHGKPEDCAAITLVALSRRMNPFFVAQKTHISQSGAIGYEGQLVNAMIQSSGELADTPNYEHFGPWEKILGRVEEKTGSSGGRYYAKAWPDADEEGLGVIVRATLRGERQPRELRVLLRQCWPRFSTQWATDPQQQIGYLALRKFVRLHKPGVLLGIFTDDELAAVPGETFMGNADVVETPKPTSAPAPATYPAEEFDKNFPAWSEAITSGRGHASGIIKRAETRWPLSDEQKQKLQAVKPAHQQEPKATPAPTPEPTASPAVQDVAPRYTYAQVADKLHRATTRDELSTAATMIDAVNDDVQRVELRALYDERRDALAF